MVMLWPDPQHHHPMNHLAGSYSPTLFRRCLVQCSRQFYCPGQHPCNARHGGTTLQHCTACGREISDNARFCRHCGHTLNSENVDTVIVNPGRKKQRQPLNDLTTVSTHPLTDISM